MNIFRTKLPWFTAEYTQNLQVINFSKRKGINTKPLLQTGKLQLLCQAA